MSDHAPGLPEIRDEAGDTPMWVPILGLGLLILATLYLVVSAAFADAEPEAPAEAVQAEVVQDVAEPAAP